MGAPTTKMSTVFICPIVIFIKAVSNITLDSLLREQIRQKCVHKFHPELYSDYIREYYLCKEHQNRNCINDTILDSLPGLASGAYYSVQSCINESLTSKCQFNLDPSSGLPGEDVKKYKQLKIFRIPQIRLNNDFYRGKWNYDSIFNSICEKMAIENCYKRHSSKAQTIILVICVTIILFIAIIAVLSYRIMVNRNVNRLIEERIQTQAMTSITQFRNYKEDKLSMKEGLISN